MFDQKKRFVIQDYNKRITFSSFLPGIAGVRGIPVWSFYVNRGQAVCSFGSRDKQNPIMEFFPAHTSYQLVRQRGFRTFLKVDGEYYEPFSSDELVSDMAIGENELYLSEVNEKLGVKVEVTYYILPEERIGALVRQLSITNLKDRQMKLECLDGMSSLIPYGTTLRDMKEVTQLIQAWMQVEHADERMPFYHLSASSADSTQVSEIHEGNFYLAFDGDGTRLPVIVDPELIFRYDTQMNLPVSFLENSPYELLREKQVTENQMPCAFSCMETVLEPGSRYPVNSLIGHAANYSELVRFTEQCRDAFWFEAKEKRAVELTDEITRQIETKTASLIFDEYCKQTYLDNLLRGGFPIRLTNDRPFYVYSRKHGDLERDYNSFSMSPEFYSQGNGNYRDVSQNRRNDLIFAPFVRDYNIKRFYNLIQLDGCNPLVLLQSQYRITEYPEEMKKLSRERRQALEGLLQDSFTPGQLAAFLEDGEDELFRSIIENSTEDAKAELDDGYWTDHWTYNLDLVESYLQIFPEEAEKLLFDDRSYSFYESQAMVLPRKDRYIRTKDGLRQFGAIKRIEKKEGHTRVRTSYGSGETYYSSLAEKMFLLSVTKFSSLDPAGKGLEMEGGKPGWYDALNGLPALFGSSMCDSYELKRQLLFLEHWFTRCEEQVLQLPVELKELADAVTQAVENFFSYVSTKMDVWNQSHMAMEAYREKTLYGISGEKDTCMSKALLPVIRKWISYMDEGIHAALEENCGMPPAYCAYRIQDFTEKDGVIEFQGLEEIKLPDFLEGPVRYLKLPMDPEKKQELYRKVKTSGLYDPQLHMYKVNAPLTAASHEIGRARAFSRGWLENESIWLHMEYKYLLELLKSGMYEEFFEDLKTACIPFLDDEVYGRSLTENSSFIVSSVHANKKLHGRGYVARLSGSTAEFLSMWQWMFLGVSFTRGTDGQEQCHFSPAVPSYLIPEDGIVKARLFGNVDIIYRIEGKGDVIPGRYQIDRYEVHYRDGHLEKNRTVLEPKAVRALKMNEIAEVVMDLSIRWSTTE